MVKWEQPGQPWQQQQPPPPPQQQPPPPPVPKKRRGCLWGLAIAGVIVAVWP